MSGLFVSILNMSLIGSPLAFSEGNVKGRIKNVLNYKKPKFWVILVSIIILVISGIGLIFNPIGEAVDDIMNGQIRKPYDIVFLYFISSSSKEYFLDERKDNEYNFDKNMFEVFNNDTSETVSIVNPKYKKEDLGKEIMVMGDLFPLDISKYSRKESFNVYKSDGNDTGYIIYKMDNEIWISHWGWYGEKHDSWWCEYILKIK